MPVRHYGLVPWRCHLLPPLTPSLRTPTPSSPHPRERQPMSSKLLPPTRQNRTHPRPHTHTLHARPSTVADQTNDTHRHNKSAASDAAAALADGVETGKPTAAGTSTPRSRARARQPRAPSSRPRNPGRRSRSGFGARSRNPRSRYVAECPLCVCACVCVCVCVCVCDV